MEGAIRLQLQSHREVMETIEQQLTPAIAAFGSLLAEALRGGKKLLVMGNGGSAADAQLRT